MPRYKITIEYDGTNYSGWQRQADRASVQEALETAIFKMTGEQTGLCVAGRTDAGVHALHQVAHFDLSRDIPTYNIMHGINYHLTNDNLSAPSNFSAPSLTLPRKQGRERWSNLLYVPPPACGRGLGGGHSHSIAVINAEIVGDDFHARFSAKSRTYLYRILNRPMKSVLDHNRVWHVRQPLDVSQMNQAAMLLLGRHDFTSFRDSHCQAKSPIRTLDVLDIKQQGQEIHITTKAQSFLHSQVRIMVGTLKCVGEGKLHPQEIKNILAVRKRTAAPLTAPAHGLYLAGVEYST